MKLGAFAIIKEGNQVLLCHRCDIDIWNLPGGRVEQGESPWDAVVREVQEEIGLMVRVSKLIGLYFKPEQDEVVFSFACEQIGGKLQLNDEADRIEYWPVSGLPPNFSPIQAERVQDAWNEIDTVIMKEQRGPTSFELFGS
jgi:ADP-ribose pyrophosphatase YjhB (NUDIX family)